MISLFLLFACVIIGLLVATLRWYLTIPSNLPPGPIGLPFIGSSLDTWRSSNVHKKLQQWTELYGPIYKFYVAEKLVVVLGDWNVIREALVTQGDVFAGRPHMNFGGGDISGTGLTHSYGEKHKIQRRFALTTLRDLGFGRSILEPMISSTCGSLIEKINSLNGRPFDPKIVLGSSVNKVICSMVFGQGACESEEEIDKVLRFLSGAFESPISILTPFALSNITGKIIMKLPIAKFVSAFQPKEIVSFHDFIGNGIKSAMKDFDVEHDEPSNYVQAFRKAQQQREDNWSFTEKELGRNAADLFAAGTDTTTNTLAWAIFHLAHNPEVQEKVYEEIQREAGGQSLLNYTDRNKLPFTMATIMETQRMANLLPLGVLRKTTADCKVYGYDIPADAVVVPLLTAALYDPKVYENPEAFDPMRFLKNGENTMEANYLIPFSVGKRNCLGESLAKMELFLFLTALMSHFKFSFPPGERAPLPSEERVGIIRAPPVYNVYAIRRADE